MRGLAATVAAGAVLLLPSGTAHAASSQPGDSVTASVPPSASASASDRSASASPAPAPAASGNPLCSAVVVDSAGVLSGDDVEALRSAGEDLGQTTELRIRTVAHVPGGDLNAYEEQLQQSCHWADASHQRQPTLLVLLLDTDDRQTGIYPGPTLTPVLTDKVWLAIEQKAMRPALAKGDWTGGLQAGLQALDQLVGPNAAPSASFDPSALASAGGSTKPSGTGPAEQPATASGVLSPPVGAGGSGFPIVGVGIAVVVGLGVIGAATTAFRRTGLRQPFGTAPGWEAGQGSTLGLTDPGGAPGGGDSGPSPSDGGGGSASDSGGGSSAF